MSEKPVKQEEPSNAFNQYFSDYNEAIKAQGIQKLKEILLKSPDGSGSKKTKNNKKVQAVYKTDDVEQ